MHKRFALLAALLLVAATTGQVVGAGKDDAVVFDAHRAQVYEAGGGMLARGGNDRLLLSRVAVVGCQGDGARIAASDGVVLDRCSFDLNGGDGLDVAGRGTKASRLSFRDGRAAAAVLRGEDATLVDSLFVGGPQGVVFAGTRASASRCSFRGVALAARFGSTSDTCTFQRNDVRACSTAAVTDLGSIYNTISDNRVVGATGDAIRLLGTWHTAEGNDLSALGASGIVASGDSFHIAGNRVDRPAGAGLALSGSGCMVEGNRLVAPAGPGMTVEGDGNVIALNDCAGAGSDAVVVTGTMNRVVGNTAEDAAGEGIRLAGDGNTLQDDVLVRTGGNGIHVASGSANRAEGNAITNCGGAGFLDEGVGTTLLRNRIN